MTEYALRLLKRHDQRIAAEKNAEIASKLQMLRTSIKKNEETIAKMQQEQLAALAAAGKKPERATPEIIAFNESNLTVGG